jgi:guanidinopropionase
MKHFPQPIDTTQTPRFAGHSSFMRMPIMHYSEVDIALLGVPWDGGTTNRAGARHGPKHIREMSSFIRKKHHVSGIEPFNTCRIADCGDASVNPMDLMNSMERIEKFYHKIHELGVMPISAGGDHLMTLPILRAIAKDQPVGVIQFDAHSDTFDSFFGVPYTHGTGFRHAIEEGLIDPKRFVQIGLRGAVYGDDLKFAREAGVRIILIEEFYELGVDGVIEEARRVVGDGPTYVSFDVDGLDPVYAPGTGTPEVGGFTTFEAQRMIRGLEGLNLIGGDIVEVSPPFDPMGNTALVAATMMFEMLCILADSWARQHNQETLR